MLAKILPYLQTLIGSNKGPSLSEQAIGANAMNAVAPPGSPAASGYNPQDIAAIGPVGGAPPLPNGSADAVQMMGNYSALMKGLKGLDIGNDQQDRWAPSFKWSSPGASRNTMPGPSPGLPSIGSTLASPAGQQLIANLRAMMQPGGAVGM